MTSLRWLLRGPIFLLSLFLPQSVSLSTTPSSVEMGETARSVCTDNSPKFNCTAESSEKFISFTNDGSDMEKDKFEWTIEADSSGRQITFRITDFFVPAGSGDCLVIKNGDDDGEIMRLLSEQPACSAKQTSGASSITLTYTIKSKSKQNRGFVLKFQSIPQAVQKKRMAVYSTGHYILMAASAVVFVILAGSIICLVRRERMREEQKREKVKKEKLGRRRKGISGISGWDLSSDSPDPSDDLHTDTTTFVESLGMGSSTLSV